MVLQDIMLKYELLVKAVFIILISVSVNFLGSTINCDLQGVLTNVPIARHICFIFMLVFLMDFLGKSKMAPLKMIGSSIIVYMVFLLIAKQGGLFLSINLGVILVIYLLSLQVSYTNDRFSVLTNQLNDIKEEDVIQHGKTINNYNNIRKVLVVMSGGLVLFGFGSYLNKQMIDHKDNFNFATFILGTNQCRQLASK